MVVWAKLIFASINFTISDVAITTVSRPRAFETSAGEQRRSGDPNENAREISCGGGEKWVGVNGFFNRCRS